MILRSPVDMEDLPGDEGGLLQVVNPSTTSLISPARPSGWTAARSSYEAGSCIGVLIPPSETVLTRTPRAARCLSSLLYRSIGHRRPPATTAGGQRVQGEGRSRGTLFGNDP